MAEIEIIYRSSRYCWMDKADYCMQCHTAAAKDLGCRAFRAEAKGKTSENSIGTIPFGNCIYAKFRHSRKGWAGKRYEIGEPEEDPYNWHLNTIPVVLGNTLYEYCVKVTLNGKVIYNNYDDEEVEQE